MDSIYDFVTRHVYVHSLTLLTATLILSRRPAVVWLKTRAAPGAAASFCSCVSVIGRNRCPQHVTIQFTFLGPSPGPGPFPLRTANSDKAEWQGVR